MKINLTSQWWNENQSYKSMMERKSILQINGGMKINLTNQWWNENQSHKSMVE